MTKAARVKRILTFGWFLATFGLLAAPSQALDVPLTAPQAQEAISAGTAGMSALILDPRWHKYANIQTYPGYTPTCLVFTPYFWVALQSSEDVAKYTTEAPAQAKREMKDHTLMVRFRNFSPVLGANGSSVGVIHQNGKVIHATKKELGDEDVITVGDDAGYEQNVEFTFDTRQFDPTQAFTVGMANTLLYNATYGEALCAVGVDTP